MAFSTATAARTSPATTAPATTSAAARAIGSAAPPRLTKLFCLLLPQEPVKLPSLGDPSANRRPMHARHPCRPRDSHPQQQRQGQRLSLFLREFDGKCDRLHPRARSSSTWSDARVNVSLRQISGRKTRCEASVFIHGGENTKFATRDATFTFSEFFGFRFSVAAPIRCRALRTHARDAFPGNADVPVGIFWSAPGCARDAFPQN